MANLLGFDAARVDPARPYGPVPAGKYLAVLEASEMKSNKLGTGQFLELTLKVVEGDYANRLLWARLNLSNPNKMAEEIARAELSAICRAVGVMAPADSAELHNIPLMVHVRCKKREDTGELANEIAGYSAVASVSTASNGAPPWK